MKYFIKPLITFIICGDIQRREKFERFVLERRAFNNQNTKMLLTDGVSHDV